MGYRPVWRAALDGEQVTPGERAAAEATLPGLEADLDAMGAREGDAQGCEALKEAGGGVSGETQPWCPATRVQDQRSGFLFDSCHRIWYLTLNARDLVCRESERRKEEAAAAAAAAAARLSLGDPSPWRQRPQRAARVPAAPTHAPT